MTIRCAAAFDVPIEVNAVEGEVVLLGPDGISGSFTPLAARTSAERLLSAAELAERQSAQDGHTP